MNMNQLQAACHAVIENHQLLGNPQASYNQQVSQICHQLADLYVLGGKIARSKTDPFKQQNRQGLNVPELVTSRLGHDFIALMAHLNLPAIRDYFPQHDFNPVIHLMLEIIEHFQLAGAPPHYLYQQGYRINQCFNTIRIEYHIQAFQCANKQWWAEIMQQRQDFKQLTEGLLKTKCCYLLYRLELFYCQGINPYPEQVEQHGQLLLQALQDKNWSASLLAACLKLDYSRVQGYRYALLLISSDHTPVDFDGLAQLWQQQITQQQGGYIIHQSNQLAYRNAGVGLHQLGDIYQQSARQQLLVDLVDTGYLVRTKAAKALHILLPEQAA